MKHIFVQLTQENNLGHLDVTKLIKFMVIFMAGLWVTGVYCSGGDYLRNKVSF